MKEDGLWASMHVLGLSQADLARRLGRTPKAVSDWVTGKKPVPKYVAEYLLLACELSYLRDEVNFRIDRALEANK